MQGKHSPIRAPIKVDQITLKETVVQDYDQSYTSREIYNSLCKYVCNLEYKTADVEVPTDEGVKTEELIYFSPAGNPNVALLVRNVTYLGKPHPSFKKRIQIPPKWRIFTSSHPNMDIHFLGLYHYNDLELIVDFEKEGFVTSNAKNASAHVMAFDLFQGLVRGVFSKIDAFGHRITVFKPDQLSDYILTGWKGDELTRFIGEINEEMPFGEEIMGIDAYTEMYDSDYAYANEAEWPGFYVEFKFSEILKHLGIEDKIQYLGRKGKEDEELELDLFFGEESFYGDIKSSNIAESTLYGNKISTTDEAIDKYGKLWYIVYLYDSERDVNHGSEVAKWWTENKRSRDRKERGEGHISYRVRMKYSIVIREMYIIQIDGSNRHHLLKEGEVSGGRVKYAMSKKNLENFILFRYKKERFGSSSRGHPLLHQCPLQVPVASYRVCPWTP